MIYFLYGLDTYRSRAKLREIIGAFQKKAGGAFNVTRLDAEDEPGAVRVIGRASSLFAAKELYAIERISAAVKEDQEYVRETLARWKADRNLTVIFWEAELDDKSGILAAIKKHATKSQEFTPLSAAAVRRWLADEAGRRNIALAREEAGQLSARFGSDLWALSGELEKIASGWSERSSLQGEKKVWDFTDEFLRRRRMSILPLENLLAAGYEPVYLVGALAGALRTLALVRDGVSRGNSRGAFAGLHPYVVKKNTELARSLRRQDVRRYFSELLAADLEFKTGRLPGPLPLVKLVLWQ